MKLLLLLKQSLVLKFTFIKMKSSILDKPRIMNWNMNNCLDKKKAHTYLDI
jgi:hypothetical protein